MPVNVGNPDEITIKAFAEEVLELVNNPKAKLTFKELPEDDPKRRKPDISLARKLLDWNPTVSRRDGLKTTLAYFKTVVQ